MRLLHEAAQFHSWWNRKPQFRLLVCLDFSLEIAVQTVQRVCTRVIAEKRFTVCSGAKNICLQLARHHNYRQVLNLRSRYRRKTKNRLPPKITAAKTPQYFGFTASAKVVTAEKWKTAYRQKFAAVLHYRLKNTATFWFYRFRQSRYRQKRENRQSPKSYRRVAIPPRLCPPK